MSSTDYISAESELARHMDIQIVSKIQQLNLVTVFKALAARGANELIKDIMMYLKDFHDDESSEYYLERIQCMYDAAYHGHWDTIVTIMELYKHTNWYDAMQEYVVEGAIHADNRDILRRCMDDPRLNPVFQEPVYPYLEYCVAYRRHHALYILLSFYEEDALYRALRILMHVCVEHLDFEGFQACWNYSSVSREFLPEIQQKLEEFKTKGYTRPVTGLASKLDLFRQSDIDSAIENISKLMGES